MSNKLQLYFDSDDEELELKTMDSSKLDAINSMDDVSPKENQDHSSGLISNKLKAIIFINIYCVFDTVDNINAKSATAKGVDFLDLAFSRMAMNFVSACFFVYFCNQNVFKSVPAEFYGALGYRSVMMLMGQTLNCFAI